ncbi:cytochrome c biogenesis protein DipZ [Candidatus Peregrinibacteria bacterium CG_4_9_14_0_2_um_filter_53_11]|nr:MAG: cytochrome c biogenesis protein DipZ [Candidatus Peregrinibacteria bacterium CG_4_9_14_0_2_um_filter_53_11]
MLLLIGFAFLAGIVTILSPCILPILPIVLSGSVGGGKRRPFGIVVGFILSFTFFTLALSTIVSLTGLSSNALRTVSIVVIFLFGIALLVPRVQVWMEILFGKMSGLVSAKKKGEGFISGVFLGLSLGLLWTPCVGPILASVITLAATSTVNSAAFFITLAYAMGTAIPMFFIIYGGRQLLNRVPWLLRNTGKIQKIFGVLMILTAVAIYFNIDRKFQAYVIETFPQYGAGLTKFEDQDIIYKQLDKLSGAESGDAEALPEGQFPQAPELIPGGEWINSAPLTLESLKGKVVLVDFWTYTCINCIRTLPYLQSWHEKYADKGLVIIGVHTPEFDFEKDLGNVQKAVADFGLTYPIVQDNDYKTWRAYNNRFWPAKYFIDKEGRVRSTHFGEGEYNESEELIQELLKETGADLSAETINNPDYKVETLTPETYLGYGRLSPTQFSSPEQVTPDAAMAFSTPAMLKLNQFGYAGEWNLSSERANPSVGAKLRFNVAARKVFLVMRTSDGKPGRLRVTLDGKALDSALAADDVKDGVVTVQDDRLYTLLNLPGLDPHELQLEALDGNVELFAFTFG